MDPYHQEQFEKFLAKQRRICKTLKKAAKKVQKTGTKPSLLKGCKGGYLIAFRFSQQVTEIVGKLSEKINKIIPSLVYDGKNAHTTIYTIDHKGDGTFYPNPEKLRVFANHIHDLEKELSAPQIVFRGWLYNESTVIASGTPTKEFYEAFDKIGYKICSEVSSDLIKPWGAHITTARFKEEKSAEQMQEFFHLMRTTPAISTQKKKNRNYTGIVKPTSIDVGSFDFSAEGFEYTVSDSLKLQYAHLDG